MIILLSPAKSLDFETNPTIQTFTQPRFLEDSKKVNLELRKKSAADLQKLMNISQKLGELNAERNFSWTPPFSLKNAKQAILAFNGDVYEGLQAESLNDEQFEYTQKTIRILSGLYGILRPLDLIQPYRLEMGIKLPVGDNKNLYEFWSEKLTASINEELNTNPGPLINLASQEYFKVINQKELKTKIITPVFKDAKNGKYKIISFYAKKARGLMSRFAIENELNSAEDLKAFDIDGYNFNAQLSNEKEWIFTRGEID